MDECTVWKKRSHGQQTHDQHFGREFMAGNFCGIIKSTSCSSMLSLKVLCILLQVAQYIHVQ